MTKFRCKRCNYRFESERELMPKSCPNCGERDVVRKEPSADELLNGSEWN
ncbi:MAG: hypothetical protein WC781_03785 [Candidatus Pacearchaeota archaeon]|jgi:DNA-directed RNA polymerase subunit RPC12/RpoP